MPPQAAANELWSWLNVAAAGGGPLVSHDATESSGLSVSAYVAYFIETVFSDYDDEMNAPQCNCREHFVFVFVESFSMLIQM